MGPGGRTPPFLGDTHWIGWCSRGFVPRGSAYAPSGTIAPGAESPYFRRLRKAENLVVEFAGVVKSVLRGKKILEQWLVDSGFVDSAL